MKKTILSLLSKFYKKIGLDNPNRLLRFNMLIEKLLKPSILQNQVG